MSNTKHTPGPWAVNRPCVEAAVDGKRQTVATCLTLVRWDDEDSGFSDTIPEREANARLIAAAPDLLEAIELLQGFDFRLDDSDHGKEIRRRALAAIAKANG